MNLGLMVFIEVKCFGGNMRIAMGKEAIKRKYNSSQGSQILKSERNWLGVKLGALLYVAQRPGH